MADLTDIKNDLIIVCPDAKSMTAFIEWENGLKSEEKANFSVIDNTYVVSAPDPLGTLDEKRKEFIELIDKEADSAVSIVRLKFTGQTFASISMQVATPPEDDK